MKELVRKNFKYKLALFITILGLIGLVSGTSYAILRGNVTSENEQMIRSGSVVLKLTENYKSINKAIPVLSDVDGLEQENAYSFNLRNIGDVASSYTVKLVNEVPAGYTGDILDLKYIKVGLEINGEEHGPFSLSEVENIIDSNVIYADEIINYELRLWIDEAVKSKISEIKDDITVLKIEVDAKQASVRKLDYSGANSPILSKNMIPVYYDATCNEEEGCWRKADRSNDGKYKWYNYDEKMWANSVTVSSENRVTYLKAEPGTEIPMNDILTMQVWVPRYKYTIWNYNSSGNVGSNPQPIKIEFERGKTTTGEIECTDNIQGTSDGTPSGTVPTTSEICKIKATNEECTDSLCNGKTYTHPAFTFGDKELEGIWLGKFETRSIDNYYVVKPDLKSWSGQNIGLLENNMMAMNNNGNIYGFASSDDTHMIKNMEWGATMYLSHSEYGTCDDGVCREISYNNSDGGYTGRSGGFPDMDDISDGTYRYNQVKTVITKTSGGVEESITSITNDITYPWTENEGLYKSSTQGVNSSTTNLEFSFNVNSENTYLSFDWSVSSEGCCDNLYYTIKKDGTTLSETGTITKIGGTSYGTTESSLKYENKIIKLDSGSYTLIFTYKKDSSVNSGTDTAYIKNVKLINNPLVDEEIIELEEGKDGPSASTTGNVYGIYDMSGGKNEYVMANIVSPDGKTMLSGNKTSSNYYYSGYTGIVYIGETEEDYTLIKGDYSYPENKYIDKYSFSTTTSQRSNSKLGDAMKEVLRGGGNNWYSDYSYFLTPNEPWGIRGGRSTLNMYNGAFGYFGSYGGNTISNSSRFVIAQ